MATDRDFVEYVCEQITGTAAITYKKMFGEYALYSGGKVFAFACDNQLFVKPTQEGKAFIGKPVEAPPYPGAKLYFMVNEKLDDSDWLSQLVRITCSVLPEPKPKTPKSTTSKKSAKSK